ncbi:MAG: hypothetical protein AMXMBFR59_29820 [Rhodanobacteraceae bacterium]
MPDRNGRSCVRTGLLPSEDGCASAEADRGMREAAAKAALEIRIGGSCRREETVTAAGSAATECPVGHPCATPGNPAGRLGAGFMPGAEISTRNCAQNWIDHWLM